MADEADYYPLINCYLCVSHRLVFAQELMEKYKSVAVLAVLRGLHDNGQNLHALRQTLFNCC